MSTVEVLKAAKALIEDPARWTQETWARDEIGVPVLSRSTEAVQWCALGAVHRIDSSSTAIDRLEMADPLFVSQSPSTSSSQ